MNDRFRTLLPAATLLVAFSASAQTPTLVKDIYPGASATLSAPAYIDRVLGVSNGRVFMNASAYDAAMGLWPEFDGTR